MPDPRERMRDLQRMADRVCVLILSSDLPAIDIEIEKNKVRELCLELYPDREQLYEMVYESRFQRLWDQFRDEEMGRSPSPPAKSVDTWAKRESTPTSRGGIVGLLFLVVLSQEKNCGSEDHVA